jgi:hypothetical protein
MRLILATVLTVMVAASLSAPVVHAGVVIDMPAPRKAAKVNVAAAAADAASSVSYSYSDVGSLALARYGGAREGTYDNYFNIPYRNYDYPWPYGWGMYYGNWPIWGFGWGCFSSCAPCGRVCR